MLKLSYKTAEEIPEAFRSLYKEVDGAWVLQVDGLEDSGGLKKALAEERKAMKALEAQIAAWKKIGKTPDEIAELTAAAQQAEEEKARNAGQWDKLRDQLNTNHANAMKSKEEENARLRKTIDGLMVDSVATVEIANAKGSPQLLLPHVQKHTRVVEENGEFVTRVVDAKGDPRLSSSGAFMTIAELVSEMRSSENYGRAFEASGHTGSGMQPTLPGGGMPTGGSQPRTPTSWADAKSAKEKAEFLKTKPGAPQNQK